MGVRRVVVPVAVACATLLAPAAAAAAAEPERTGWWNRVSVGGAVLPQPTAQPGDLRIASGPQDVPTAYAAVLYSAPGSAAATLDLAVRSASGTPEVVACPTGTTDWPEGGNQPYDKAPAYDCDLGLAFGSLSADGKTLSFVLDATTQLEPGVWSLALVPSPEATGLFSVDVVAPEDEAFQAEAPDTPGAPAAPTESGTSTDGGPESGSGQALLAGGFEAPPSFDTGTTDLPPLVAAEAAPEPATAPEPAVAGGAAPAATPLLLARPAAVGEDVDGGRRLLALLVLVGGSAAVGYAAGQQRPGPRLIGGRSRLAVPAAGPAVPAALPGGEDRPRGIGRFAKTRDAAPRRLR